MIQLKEIFDARKDVIERILLKVSELIYKLNNKTDLIPIPPEEEC
jgi:hypothetical protein